jgi:hypothetical protein
MASSGPEKKKPPVDELVYNEREIDYEENPFEWRNHKARVQVGCFFSKYIDAL